MAHKLTTALIATSALALSACSTPQWNNEAGAFIDEGRFGEPTLNNTLVHTGQASVVLDLNRRFAAEVPTTVNFAFDSAVLSADARAALRQQAAWIKQFREVTFRVYGHTDLVGSDAYNKQLGQRRANAVVAYLVSQGISRTRLEAVVSFGETQPLVVTDGREPRNRRTVTEVTGFVKGTPPHLHGKFAQRVFQGYINSAGEAPTDGGTEGLSLGGGG